MTTTPITITITNELHEALLTAASMVDDAIEALSPHDFVAMPYVGESLGDVRDLLNMIASGNLETIGA